MKKQTKSLCLSWKTSICMFLGLVMCLGVASCDGDDESVEPSKQNVPKRKKLVSIFTNYHHEYPSIEYDAYGRLSRIEETYKQPSGSGGTYYHDFTYIGDTLKIFNSCSDKYHSSYNITFLLNAQGCVSKEFCGYCSVSQNNIITVSWQRQFLYDSDGHLVSYEDEKADIALVQPRKYVFSNDNLLKTIFLNNESCSYLYTGDENKANIMIDEGYITDFIFGGGIRDGISTILYNAGLLGKASKNLVSRNVFGNYECRFTYAFDSDGYPNYIEIDSYYNGEKQGSTRQFFLAYK